MKSTSSMSAAASTSRRASRRGAIVLLWLALAAAGARAEHVTVYTNATIGPLVIDASTGMYPEMLAYLNQLRLGGLDFTLKTIPRKRMQVELDNGTLDGIVIGMMPQWVGDAAQQKFLWTEPFSRDHFVLVSHKNHPYFFRQPAAAPGARIGVTLGYVYPGVDGWIAAGKFVRDEAANEERNLDKLLLGRVDMAIVSESVFRYYARTHNVTGLSTEALPGQPTERRFLVPKSQRAVYERLAPAIRLLNEDPAWRRVQDQY